MGNAQSNTLNEVETIEKLYDKQMQRQIVLAEELFAEKQALKNAHLRVSLFWEYLAAGTIAISMLFYGLKTKNKLAIIPAIPGIMIVGYHTDQLTQEFINNVHTNAEKILHDPKQKSIIRPIGGAITLAELDERRKRWKIVNSLNNNEQ